MHIGGFARQDKNDEKWIQTTFYLTFLFEQRPGTAPTAIWVLLGRQLGVQDGQHGSQDGLLGVQDGPTCRPEVVQSAFLRDLDATKTNPKRPEMAKTRFS